MSSQDVLQKSINFHDPKGKLASGDYTFHLEETRPDGSSKKTNVRFAPSKEMFDIISFREGRKITYEIHKENINILLDDSANYSKEDIENTDLKKNEHP